MWALHTSAQYSTLKKNLHSCQPPQLNPQLWDLYFQKRRALSRLFFLFLHRSERVSNLYSFDTDPKSSILGWTPIRIRIQSGSRGFMTKNWKKITAEQKKLNFLDQKLPYNYLYIRLHKGRPSYKRSLQLSKENIQHFKTWSFFTFSTFVGHFWPPESGSTDLIECGSNPDPKSWFPALHQLILARVGAEEHGGEPVGPDTRLRATWSHHRAGLQEGVGAGGYKLSFLRIYCTGTNGVANLIWKGECSEKISLRNKQCQRIFCSKYNNGETFVPGSK